MYVLEKPESTDIGLTREVVDAYIEKWEQDLRLKNRRESNTTYPKVNLDKLGDYRTSRWYSSFSFHKNKNDAS